jgi:hypothetical protein
MQQSLPWLVATVAIVLLAGLAALWLVRRSRPTLPRPQALPVEWDLLPRPVFTADERRLYRLLRDALPHHMVLAKLPLVRFCQPSDPKRVRYWYDVLGTTQVGFVVCSANGRVLAAIDLSYDAGGLPARATRIKQSVLGACRVRYLRCQADHLPSIPELQLLVPQQTNASRGPLPAQGSSAMPGAAARPMAASAVQPNARRRERTTLWQESTAFSDSFFSPHRGFDTSHGEPADPAGSLRPAMVGDALPTPPLRH